LAKMTGKSRPCTRSGGALQARWQDLDRVRSIRIPEPDQETFLDGFREGKPAPTFPGNAL